MNKNSLIFLVFFILTSCAPSYEGDSMEAHRARQDFANEMVQVAMPEGCTYVSVFNAFKCLNEDYEAYLRENHSDIEQVFYDHIKDYPSETDSERLDNIVLMLNGCTDDYGKKMSRDAKHLYCKVKLNRTYEKKPIRYLGVDNGRYHYLNSTK